MDIVDQEAAFQDEWFELGKGWGKDVFSLYIFLTFMPNTSWGISQKVHKHGMIYEFRKYTWEERDTLIYFSIDSMRGSK